MNVYDRHVKVSQLNAATTGAAEVLTWELLTTDLRTKARVKAEFVALIFHISD